MATHDIEMFIDDLQTHLNATLNTKIAAINSEKNDSITLLTVDSNAYFIQTMDDTIANYDPYVYIGIQTIASTGIGPYTGNVYTIIASINLADAAGDVSIGKRILRYHRALTEVIQEKYSTFSDSLKTKVRSLEPISFRFLDTSHNFRAVGVEIDVAIS